MSKILFIVPYPFGQAPSQRFRFEQYLELLTAKGFDYKLSSFIGMGVWKILYKEGFIFTKITGICLGFFKRFFLMLSSFKYDFIFIHREAAPIGPPVFEWILAKVLRKKIIYDFDDAIWMSLTSESNKIAANLKWHSKVSSICRWSYKISCGNDFLCSYAREFNDQVYLIPTTIDTINHHNEIKDQDTEEVTIGWTGTHSNILYLDSIVPVIKRLESKYKFKFLVISNQNPNYDLKSFVFMPWKKDSEISDLLKLNIGLMPLEEDLSPLSLGKCGFKALQYMALGIPALASPVGVNKKIIKHAINGYLCSDSEDWYNYLEILITNSSMRSELGLKANEEVQTNYSVNAISKSFLDLFK